VTHILLQILPILLKVKLFDKEKPFTKKVIQTADEFAIKKVSYVSKIDGSEVENLDNIKIGLRDTFYKTEYYYSKQDGSYLGNPDFIYRLVKRFAIIEFYGYDSCKTASIGWSPKLQKWFGWGHRAINSFGIGSERVAGHIAFLKYGYMKAETLADARLMAEQFARDVS